MYEIIEVKTQNGTIIKIGQIWTDGFDTLTVKKIKDNSINFAEDQPYTWRLASQFGVVFKLKTVKPCNGIHNIDRFGMCFVCKQKIKNEFDLL